MDLTGEGWLALSRRIRREGGPIEDAEYAVLRARVLLGSGQAVDRELLMILAMMPGREADVVALATELFEANPACPPAALCSEALIDLERHEEALQWADRALSADPASTYAMHAKAVALRRLGRPEDAESVLVQALRIDPSGDDVRFQLFALKSRPSLGDPEPEILQLGLKLIELAPPEPTLLCMVANAHYRANNMEEARRLYELAVARADETGTFVEDAKKWLEDFKDWQRPE